MEFLTLLTITVASLLNMVTAQVRPPNLSPDNLPDTAFTCEDKVTGGYYADVEADCQLFHVCVQVSEYEFQDFHFLCPNDTVFDQQHLVCTNWFEVDCHAQLAFFTNDFGIKRGSASFEDEDIRGFNDGAEQQNGFLGFNGQSSLLGQTRPRSRNNGRGSLEVGRRRSGFNQRRFPVRHFDEYENDDQEDDLPAVSDSFNADTDIPLVSAITGSTPIPLGFTTTIRPAGRSGIKEGGFLSGRHLKNFGREDSEQNQLEFDEPTEAPIRKPSFSKFGRDGRRPKVKSNIRAKLANNHRGKKKFFNKLDKPRKKSGRRVNLDHGHRKKIEFVEPTEDKIIEEPFTGPEVRPDGRAPRVKANQLRAEQQNRVETTTLQPFIEQFFASPSSPQPFIFQGTPTPRSIRSTEQPFFIPTIKGPSTFSPLDNQQSFKLDGDDESFNEIQSARNRFISRPSPTDRFNGRKRTRGRHRVVITDDQPSETFSHDDDSTNHINNEVPTFTEESSEPTSTTAPAISSEERTESQTRPRVKSNLRQRKKFRQNTNDIEQNSVQVDSSECNDPFRCPPKFKVAGGRRPRVKSNVRAKKRNFWQKRKGFAKDGSAQLGQFNPNRKIRRGRKQKASPKTSAHISNDIFGADNSKVSDHKESDRSDISTTTQEHFFPTSGTTTRKEPETTTTVAPVEEENDNFIDIFDQENDLFVASSTVSSVVFKGSPTPGIGFFSSPNPWNDGKVSFTSPSPFGHGFGPSGRPSFNNIGAHVDLGPKQKILPPNQLFFISSTMSNKIVIGTEEATETTTTPRTTEKEDITEITTKKVEAPKRSFPSFPIRGGLLGGQTGFPFRPKPSFPGLRNTGGIPFSFSRKKVSSKKEKKEKKKDTEDKTTSLETTIPTESGPTTLEFSESTTDPVTEKLKHKKSPRVKSNLLFNRGKHQGKRNRFIKNFGSFAKTTTTTTTTTSELIEDHTPTETTVEQEVTSIVPPTEHTSEALPPTGPLRRRFQGRKSFPFAQRAPNVGITNRLLKNRKSRGKSLKTTTLDDQIVTETTVTELQETVTEPSGNDGIDETLSVESELFQDQEIIENEINNDVDDQPIQKRQKHKKWPHVKKANRPPNANIRVEFKKASATEKPNEKPKAFFVKPDGRKPRVKSNIRARFAHRGKYPFGQPQSENGPSGFRHSTNAEEEKLDESSSTLDVSPFNGGNQQDKIEDQNTEKREVDSAEAPSENAIIPQDEKHHSVPGNLSVHKPMQPVILNTREERRSLPASILKNVKHITSLSSLPPLPGNLLSLRSKVKSNKQKPEVEEISQDSETKSVKREAKIPADLLEQIIAQTYSKPTVITSSSSSTSFSTDHQAAISDKLDSLQNKLSAFRALQKQTVQKSASTSDISNIVLTSEAPHSNLV